MTSAYDVPVVDEARCPSDLLELYRAQRRAEAWERAEAVRLR